MKSIEELKKMDLQSVLDYQKNLDKNEVSKDYLERLEKIVKILEADSVDLYDPMQEIETFEWGGARSGAGRKATGVKRTILIPAKFTTEEIEEIKKVLEIAKKKENVSSNSDALFQIIKFYNEAYNK